MSTQQQEQQKHKKFIEGMQRRLFGERFVGATLSTVSLPGDSAGTISNFFKQKSYFLVIVGPPGTGKTYMCSAFLELIPQNCYTFRAYSERQLFLRLREGINNHSGDYLAHLHELIDDDLIILDDIGSSGHNVWREEVLMEAIDHRYKDGKKTLITSNLNRDDFYNIYGKRITSRLFAEENSIVSLFGMPDLRQQGL